MKHVMLDLETLSARGDAAIIQIAAVRFDPIAGTVDEESAFNVFVNDSSGHIDPQTVAWWMQQSAAPAVGAAILGDAAWPLYSALGQLGGWLPRTQHPTLIAALVPDPDLRLWSHGATFDTPVLAAAYARVEMPVPWHYRAPRDTRTLYDLTPGGMPEVPRDDTRKHDALYDAVLQARQVCEAYRRIREGV